MFASVINTLLTSCLHLLYKKRFSENWGKFPGKYLQWTLLLIFKFAEQLQKQPPKVFFEESLIRNFAKFEGKHLCESLFFNKVVGLSPATLLKVTLAQVFSCEFYKAPFLQNSSGRLFLQLVLRHLLTMVNHHYNVKVNENKICFMYW